MTSKEIVYFYMQIKGINFKILCFGFIFTIHFDKITSKIKKKCKKFYFHFFISPLCPLSLWVLWATPLGHGQQHLEGHH